MSWHGDAQVAQHRRLSAAPRHRRSAWFSTDCSHFPGALAPAAYYVRTRSTRQTRTSPCCTPHPRRLHGAEMASKKGRSEDLNTPLRSLSERLRSLQREAADVLEAARRDVRPARRKRDTDTNEPRQESVPTSDNPLLRAAATLLERWGTPTRADLDEIRARLDRIEVALELQEKHDQSAKSAATASRSSKTRRKRTPATEA